jgi:hypothetical protein
VCACNDVKGELENTETLKRHRLTNKCTKTKTEEYKAKLIMKRKLSLEGVQNKVNKDLRFQVFMA